MKQEELLLASRPVEGGMRQVELSAPDIHCGACIRKVETSLGSLSGVVVARVNLSTRRIMVRWRADGYPPPLVETLEALGYKAHLLDVDAADGTLAQHIAALAVAGFAAGNIMLLSVSVWSGAEPEARDRFHWLSALIALPTLAYSGRVFFRSAWASLSHGRTNMDVPISIGVLLAFAMSLYDTAHHGEHAYFDAAVSLLFFLLIGRTVDHMMRERARVAVKNLARLSPRGAMVQRDDGGYDYRPVGEIAPGMTIRLVAGERVPVDGIVLNGRSDIDCGLVSGESAPNRRRARIGATGRHPEPDRFAHDYGDGGRDRIFSAEMVRLMEAAEGGRSGYRRIADRAARFYAPVVHLAAVSSFVGWMIVTDGDAHRAITIAVAVLIITCPCALGLAVPMVQMVAARRLFDSGVMVKDGAALERLAEIDSVVFDKTGTLTLGEARLVDDPSVDPAGLRLAAAIAAHSRHPHSRALAATAASVGTAMTFNRVTEYPGAGMEALSGKTVYRLGRAEWALDFLVGWRDVAADDAGTVLSVNGRLIAQFRFDDQSRPGAREAIGALARFGLNVEILSGDRTAVVRNLATKMGVVRFQAEVEPGGKVASLATLAAAGRRVLMVGDGLNDAPALAAAYVSMAPATAADVGRNAADFVFMRQGLQAVPYAVDIARRARRLVRQNLVLAVLYNVLAVPIAVLGQVTPLVAASAMSLSSILVVANALRLNGASPTAHALPDVDAPRLAARGPPLVREVS